MMDTPRKIRKPRNFADFSIKLKPKSGHPDWWSRAAVMSSFVSSVVLAGVGLAVTSSIQKAQITRVADWRANDANQSIF